MATQNGSTFSRKVWQISTGLRLWRLKESPWAISIMTDNRKWLPKPEILISLKLWTDSIEIPTAHPEFSIMESTNKVRATDCDHHDRQLDIAIWPPKSEITISLCCTTLRNWNLQTKAAVFLVHGVYRPKHTGALSLSLSTERSLLCVDSARPRPLSSYETSNGLFVEKPVTSRLHNSAYTMFPPCLLHFLNTRFIRCDVSYTYSFFTAVVVWD